MNHYFYSGRQVGAAITLAGAQETIHAMNQAIQMQQQAYLAQMMQGQYMPYSQFPMQSVNYDVYPASFFPFHMVGLISYERKRLIRVAFFYIPPSCIPRNAKRIPTM